MRKTIIPIILILALGRVWASSHPQAAEWANYYPMIAMAFIGGMLVPFRHAWLGVALVIFLSDLGANYIHGVELVSAWSIVSICCYLAIAYIGQRVQSNWKTMIFGSLVFALVFYVVANTYAWAVIPAYPKTLWGWVQSQTFGLAGFPPSYMFLKNMIGGNGLFAAGVAALSKLKSLRSKTQAQSK